MWHRVVGRAMCLASSSREGGVCVASSGREGDVLGIY